MKFLHTSYSSTSSMPEVHAALTVKYVYLSFPAGLRGSMKPRNGPGLKEPLRYGSIDMPPVLRGPKYIPSPPAKSVVQRFSVNNFEKGW
jgi:hypothetical protein